MIFLQHLTKKKLQGDVEHVTKIFYFTQKLSAAPVQISMQN